MGFKGLTLNTPPEETAHIYAEDDAAIFQSIVGEMEYSRSASSVRQLHSATTK